MHRHVETRGGEPLLDRLLREAETAMRVFLAQEFEIVRREIDDQKTACLLYTSDAADE